MQGPDLVVAVLAPDALLQLQHLVHQVVLGHVIKSLRREPGVKDHVFGRGQPAHHLGQIALARPRAGLDDGRHRPFQLARNADAVAQQLGLLLAHVAHSLHILQDELHQVGLFEKGERGLTLLGRHRRDVHFLEEGPGLALALAHLFEFLQDLKKPGFQFAAVQAQTAPQSDSLFPATARGVKVHRGFGRHPRLAGHAHQHLEAALGRRELAVLAVGAHRSGWSQGALKLGCCAGKRVLALGQVGKTHHQAGLFQARLQMTSALLAGRVGVQAEHHFPRLLGHQVLKQRRRAALRPTRGHHVGKTRLHHLQSVQHSLHQHQRGSPLCGHRIKQPAAVPGAKAMRHFGPGQRAAPIKAHHPVLPVFQRKDHTARKELLSPLVENPHSLQKLALRLSGDGQQLLAIAVADLKIPHQLLIANPPALQVLQTFGPLAKGLVPDLGHPGHQVIGERFFLGNLAWWGLSLGPAAQLGQGLRKRALAVLLQKSESIARLAAAKAVIQALLPVHAERRRPLLVKRAQGLAVLAHLQAVLHE